MLTCSIQISFPDFIALSTINSLPLLKVETTKSNEAINRGIRKLNMFFFFFLNVLEKGDRIERQRHVRRKE